MWEGVRMKIGVYILILQTIFLDLIEDFSIKSQSDSMAMDWIEGIPETWRRIVCSSSYSPAAYIRCLWYKCFLCVSDSLKSDIEFLKACEDMPEPSFCQGEEFYLMEHLFVGLRLFLSLFSAEDSVQFSSVQSCPTLCDPMDCSWRLPIDISRNIFRKPFYEFFKEGKLEILVSTWKYCVLPVPNEME